MTFKINLILEIEGIDSVCPEDLLDLCRATLGASEVVGGTDREIFVGQMGEK